MDERETGQTRVADQAYIAGTPRDQFFLEALSRPSLAVEYAISHALASAFPDKALVESDAAGMFDVEGYAAAGHCAIAKRTAPYPQVVTYWTDRDPSLFGMPEPEAPSESDATEDATADRVKVAWLDVQWREHAIEVLMLMRMDGPHHYWLLAETDAVARGFLAAVCKWVMELRGEVLVFENGGWHKDDVLFAAIQGATLESLILRGQLKQEIRDDIHGFFAAQATYEEYGIPWKRGILFVGPPGNGKTLAVKALINSLALPCLYVKNFRAQHGVDEMSIRMVFDRARRMAPCVLVLEDLDAQLTPLNRSYFLNELDGFALNRGILTLATTNHPERLDPAILDRPSRFDRKYPFDLPEPPERRAYLALWNAALKPTLRLTEDGISAIADQTEGFSFAYLKELGLSGMMAWIATPEHPPMDEVMAAQVAKLREQMVSAPPEFEPDAAQMEQMQQMQSGHMMGWHPGMPMQGHGVIRVGRMRLGG